MIFAAAGNFGISYILEIVGLVIVAGLITRYIGPPLKKLMNKKLDSIKSQLTAGDEARAEAAQLVKEQKAQLVTAKTQATQIVDQASKSALLLVEDGKRSAEEVYGRFVTRIDQEIVATKIRARQGVLDDLGAVIVSATEVVVRAELNGTSHHRLIDEAISATESEHTEAIA
jgi:F-type H+-transporting ATPase subunit b